MKSELIIRLMFFFAILAVVVGLEFLAPRRARPVARFKRWITNGVIVGLNPIFIHLIFPILPVTLALIAQRNGWGLFNNIGIPYWLAVLLGVIVLDLVIYVQHVVFHQIPALWRLHMVHHADLDIDVTTGLRFHPFEFVISMVIKLGAVVALGTPALAVIIFEILLNGTAMFNHGNINVPVGLDRYLRLFVVTPDMHRVHHSVIIRETNSNYGFNLPWWDRLFGTYRAQPARGHHGMNIGLAQYREEKQVTLWRVLIMPFTGKLGGYPKW
jgi:sterol desaturase/sphingolipid hydroxylase (fatty acid hydroxylase superfamily)